MLIKLLESLLQTTTQRYVTIWSICVENRLTRQIFRKTSLTQRSIIWIIHCDAGMKCLSSLPKRLFPVIVRFSYMYISQGSVYTTIRQ